MYICLFENYKILFKTWLKEEIKEAIRNCSDMNNNSAIYQMVSLKDVPAFAKLHKTLSNFSIKLMVIKWLKIKISRTYIL